MKSRVLICAALPCLALVLALAASPTAARAAEKGKAAANPPMDEKAMQEMMMKLSMPGPNHEHLKKLEGEWNLTVKWTMDPSKPMEQTTSTAVVKLLMDGRYAQEEVTGEMMGKPFMGMGLTGYDNILKKYVSTWIDNMSTGIMTSEGKADSTGNIVMWTGQTSDPMTGKSEKIRMTTRFIDDNKHVFTMYMKSPDKKEYQAMEITYERKM
jgi:hypothetical protein